MGLLKLIHPIQCLFKIVLVNLEYGDFFVFGFNKKY
jgi:hypothetical protein